MSADEIFNKLCMLKTLDNDDTVIYRLKDDYKDDIITFDKKLRSFNYHCARFIFKDQATWEEMNKNHEFRDDFDKHCSKYGYWGGFPNDIGIELLQAINKKVEELRMDKVKRCCKCDSDYEDEFFKYNGQIYCFECLIEQLENESNLHIVTVTHYYNEDGGELGTDDEISEVVQNICEEFEVERLDKYKNR